MTQFKTLRSAMDAAHKVEMSYGSRLCQYGIVEETGHDRYFVLVIHHAIFDGWSMELMMGLLLAAYHRSPLPRLQPYAVFIKYITDLDPEAARDYWRMQLEDARQASFPPSRRARNKRVNISRTMTSSIQFPATTQTSITKATILRAAWALVLAKYCDADDVCFGTTVSGRHAPVDGLGSISGATIATVPVRVRMRRDQSVIEFLRDIQSQGNDSIPFEQFGLQNISQVSQDARSACDFKSLLVIQPVQHLLGVADEEDSLIIPTEARNSAEQEHVQTISTYPLLLDCLVYGDHVDLVLEFQPEVVQEAQMAALSRHFEHVVHQLFQQDKRPIGTVLLTSDWDLQQAIAWNGPQVDLVPACVTELIAKQALQHPYREAVVSSGDRLTYGNLDQLSTQLAVHLTQLGVALGTMVPTCFEKSTMTIIVMLGIMKAGGVYIPLDPSHPKSRHQSVIQDTNAQYMLVSPQTAASCTNMVQNMVEISASVLSQLPRVPEEPAQLLNQPGPTDTAYVIFTSGSTGKPKGIVVEHGPLCTSIIGHQQTYPVLETSRVLQFSSYVFDSCFEEIFTPLIIGGVVCVPSDSERLHDISSFMTEMKVNIAMLTPTFVSTFSPDQVPTLETLALGGEALSRSNLDTWFGHVNLVNGYGPTEVCITCTMHHFESPNDSPTTIGRGFNANCWIVDSGDCQQLTPIGCVGELLVHGHALARGYLNDEAKTMESFISEMRWLPKSRPDDTRRFYKTGDLVKYNFDGTIEYLGRKDTQVKLRGQRIELDEVEHAMKKALQIDVLVAVDVMKQNNRDVMIAFISPTEQQNAQSAAACDNYALSLLPLTEATHGMLVDLSDRLRATLPNHMIPSLFVPLRYMPYNSSMKLDRKRLRELVIGMKHEQMAAYALSKTAKIAPTTGMELRLREIWAAVLRIGAEDIGKNDSFLEIGGDSIRAIQLVAAAQQNDISLSVAQIFETPQLSQMAVASETTGGDGKQEFKTEPFSLLSMESRDTVLTKARKQCSLSEQTIEDIYPCTGIQSDYMRLAMNFPHMYLAKTVYRLAQSVDSDRFKSTWEMAVAMSPNLRTRIVDIDGTELQVVVDEPFVWEPTAGHSLTSIVDALSSHDMGFGSRLSRCALLETDSGERYLIWVLRHAIYDGWSMSLFENTLNCAYYGIEPPKLQPYSQFLGYITQSDRKANIDYWVSQLDGAERPKFPAVDRNYGNSSESAEAVTGIMKKAVMLDRLKGSTVTKATILRASWALLLAQYCNTRDVCFGATVSGRQAPLPGLDSMAGSTITSVPVRVAVPPDQPVKEFLMGVQEHAFSMVAYEQFGLRNISSVSQDAEAVCDLSSLLVIQAEERSDSGSISKSADAPQSLISVAEDKYPKQAALQGFLPFPLLLEIHIFEYAVELDLKYHENVISHPLAAKILDDMNSIIQQVCLQDNTFLERIMTRAVI